MPNPIIRLVHSAKRAITAQEAFGRAFARELRQVLRDTERRLRPLIDEAAEGKRTAIVRAAQANRTRLAIRDILKRAGYDTLADVSTGKPFDEVVESVLAHRRLAQQAARMSGAMEVRIDALRLLKLGDLLKMGDDAAYALWQAAARGVFGSRSAQDILADLAEILDDTEPHIQTLYDTAISMYGREVELLQAGDDPETLFAYFGPVDEKTREFCLRHVGRVYTKAQIDELDNGQMDNVFLTGGGYNCRHIWTEVSAFSELRALAGSRERIPEIAEDLKLLREAA